MSLIYDLERGPGGSSSKALGYGPGSIPGVGGGGDFSSLRVQTGPIK